MAHLLKSVTASKIPMANCTERIKSSGFYLIPVFFPRLSRLALLVAKLIISAAAYPITSQ